MADDHYDEIMREQRLRTEASRVKMDALRDLRELSRDHTTAMFVVAHLALQLPGETLQVLAAEAREWQAATAEMGHPQD